MRLWHLLLVVLVLAVVLTVSREPAGCVALVVFGTLVGECVAGTAAVMLLFRTVGGFGQARGLGEHLAALAETTLVLAGATSVMAFLFWIGGLLIQAVLT